MTARTRLVAGALAAVLALISCGGASTGSLSAPARTELDSLTAQLRRAAEAFDRQGAQQALTRLRQAVASDESKGELGETRGTQILEAAAGVANLLVLDVKPTVASTTTTTTTTAVEPTTSDRGTKPPPQPGKGHKPKGHDGG
jgi:hypothetical protein